MRLAEKTTSILLAFIAMFFCAGCSSYFARTQRYYGTDSRIYPGVMRDAKLIVHPDPGYLTPAPVTVMCGLLDFIPSAALDTLLLPIDLTSPSAGTKTNAITLSK